MKRAQFIAAALALVVLLAPRLGAALAAAKGPNAATDPAWALSLEPVYASDELLAPSAAAAQGGGDSAELAKQLSNPVGPRW